MKGSLHFNKQGSCLPFSFFKPFCLKKKTKKFIYLFMALLGLCWGFPHSSVGKESACDARDPGSIPESERLPGEGIATTPVFLGFPCGSAGKESTCNVGDPGSIPGLGRSPGEGKGYPLQYPGLENSMDYLVHGVAKSRTKLSLSLGLCCWAGFFSRGFFSSCIEQRLLSRCGAWASPVAEHRF